METELDDATARALIACADAMHAAWTAPDKAVYIAQMNKVTSYTPAIQHAALTMLNRMGEIEIRPFGENLKIPHYPHGKATKKHKGTDSAAPE